MKKLIFLLLLVFSTYCQNQVETQFKDYIITEKYICGLTEKGQLKFFNKSNGKIIDKYIENNSGILLISSDRNGNIVFVIPEDTIKNNNESEHSIIRFNEQTNSSELISKCKGNLFGIVFDSKNLCYLITDRGIVDLQTYKLYYSNNSLNIIDYKDKWRTPYCYYIDKNDLIWLGFGYGEWGGDLFIFETRTKKFLIPIDDSSKSINLPIKAFFEDSTSVFFHPDSNILRQVAQ